MSIKISNERIKKAIRVIRVYDKERADTLDDRLSNIEMRVAKIAPVNMARTIENAPRDCMQRMVEQLTDQVVGKLEKLAEKKEREEIQWGKQGEAIPEDEEMEEVSFEPRVTFSQEENWKVEREHKKMEMEEQALESARHDPTIPPGENGRRFRALHQVDRFWLQRGRHQQCHKWTWKRGINLGMEGFWRDRRQGRRSWRMKGLLKRSRQGNLKKRGWWSGHRKGRCHHRWNNLSRDSNSKWRRKRRETVFKRLLADSRRKSWCWSRKDKIWCRNAGSLLKGMIVFQSLQKTIWKFYQK